MSGSCRPCGQRHTVSTGLWTEGPCLCVEWRAMPSRLLLPAPPSSAGRAGTGMTSPAPVLVLTSCVSFPSPSSPQLSGSSSTHLSSPLPSCQAVHIQCVRGPSPRACISFPCCPWASGSPCAPAPAPGLTCPDGAGTWSSGCPPLPHAAAAGSRCWWQ